VPENTNSPAVGARLQRKGWRIYLAVWLAALTLLTGWLVGLVAVRLLTSPPAPVLTGDYVFTSGTMKAPDFALRDQAGATISLDRLRGRVVALTFLDTQCRQLCPLQASLLGKVQSDLGSRTSFELVVVSVRPDADTPAAITEFTRTHGMAGRYHWLTGSTADLARTWAGYGIDVQAANGDLQHSSVIYLLDPRGYERVEFADLPLPAMVESDVRLLS
jgi:cytochrome oxidase Cu insertion factor (SCO1/SenC/PrrC family)